MAKMFKINIWNIFALNTFLKDDPISVTRFEAILPLWWKFKDFWQLYEGLLRVWQKLRTYFGNKIYAFGLILIILTGQNWKQNVTIWSHWSPNRHVSLYVDSFDRHFAIFQFMKFCVWKMKPRSIYFFQNCYYYHDRVDFMNQIIEFLKSPKFFQKWSKKLVAIHSFLHEMISTAVAAAAEACTHDTI